MNIFFRRHVSFCAKILSLLKYVLDSLACNRYNTSAVSLDLASKATESSSSTPGASLYNYCGCSESWPYLKSALRFLPGPINGQMVGCCGCPSAFIGGTLLHLGLCWTPFSADAFLRYSASLTKWFRSLAKQRTSRAFWL